jgi:hypothetical protein
MLYDPQQRPTVSNALQYPFFQANNNIPAPMNTAEATASTFTRRPVQKSEAEMKIEERAMAKQVSVCEHTHKHERSVVLLFGCR